jgi:hypothetical protein
MPLWSLNQEILEQQQAFTDARSLIGVILNTCAHICLIFVDNILDRSQATIIFHASVKMIMLPMVGLNPSRIAFLSCRH